MVGLHNQDIVEMFRSIQEKFPQLTMSIDAKHLRLDIPNQKTMDFDISVTVSSIVGLSLRVDKCSFFLGESIQNSTLSYDAVTKCAELVCGLVCGTYRYVEFYFGSLFLGSEIQSRTPHGWGVLVADVVFWYQCS